MASTSIALLQRHISAWAAYAGRGLSEEAQSEWARQFASVDPLLLAPALELVTSRARRMPWPGDLTAAIDMVRERRNFGSNPEHGTSNLRKVVVKDPETGYDVTALQDSKGGLLFSANDCPEGRQFLAAIRAVSKRGASVSEPAGHSQTAANNRRGGSRAR